MSAAAPRARGFSFQTHLALAAKARRPGRDSSGCGQAIRLLARDPEFGGRRSQDELWRLHLKANIRQVAATVKFGGTRSAIPLGLPRWKISQTPQCDDCSIRERRADSAACSGESSPGCRNAFSGDAEKTDCRFRKRRNWAAIRRFWRIQRNLRTIQSKGIEYASGKRSSEYEAVLRGDGCRGPRMDGIKRHGPGALWGSANAPTGARCAFERSIPRLLAP